VKLWVRLAAALALGAVLPLLLTGYFAAYSADRNTKLATEHVLIGDATGIANFVETWTSAQQQMVSGWTMLLPLGSASPTVQENLLESVLRADPAVVDVALVDDDGVAVIPPKFATSDLPSGRIRGSAARARELVGHLPLTSAFAARDPANAQPGVVVGEPYWAMQDDSPSMPIAVAGPWEADAVVLGAEVSLAPVAASLRQQQSEDHGIVVLSSSGQVLLGGDSRLFDQQRLGQNILGVSPDHTTTFNYVTEGGEAVTCAAAVTPTLEWTVVVLEPSLSQRSSQEIRIGTWYIVVIAVLLAVAIALVFGRSLSRPVTALRDAAIAVANGDFGRRVDVEREDEIGDLARAFNRMGERLSADQARIRAQQAEIEAFNRELQQRVEDRTRELRDAQRRLVQAGQLAAVADVTAGMAHELNNPLAAILGLAQVLKKRAEGTSIEGALARIEEQAARCREVLAALLRFGAAEVDSGPPRVVEILPLVREVVDLVQGSIRPRGVIVELGGCDPALTVTVDPLRAQRALAQVLHAIAFGLPPGSRIGVGTRAAGANAEVTLTPSAIDDDARRASGARLWMGRNLLDQLGGGLDEHETGWTVRLPGAPP
jgi:two-component system NtrC family sensor kinase